MIFAVDCPGHDSRVLLFEQNVRAVHRTDLGLEVHYTCTCGTEGVWLTGRPFAARAHAAAAA